MRPTILFVDDDPVVLTTFPRAFRRWPYDIAVAPSAAAALEILATRRVDLIVSDHRMPGMLGAELLAVVSVRWPTIARVLLTGDTGALDEKIDSAQVVLRKPSSPSEIRETVDRLLPAELVSKH